MSSDREGSQRIVDAIKATIMSEFDRFDAPEFSVGKINGMLAHIIAENVAIMATLGRLGFVARQVVALRLVMEVIRIINKTHKRFHADGTAEELAEYARKLRGGDTSNIGV